MKSRNLVFLGAVVLLLLAALLVGCKPKVTLVDELPAEGEPLTDEQVKEVSESKEIAGQAYGGIAGKCCKFVDGEYRCSPKCLENPTMASRS